jgi:hypothetical protein
MPATYVKGKRVARAKFKMLIPKIDRSRDGNPVTSANWANTQLMQGQLIANRYIYLSIIYTDHPELGRSTFAFPVKLLFTLS